MVYNIERIPTCISRSSAQADKGVRFLRPSGIVPYKESRMTSDKKMTFHIKGGPSKFDLMFSLFDGNTKFPRRTVDFKIEGSDKVVTVAIHSVQREDGSGESWNLEGNITNYTRGFGFEAYFSTSTREGVFTVGAPYHYVGMGANAVKIIKLEDQIAVQQYADSLRPA